MPSKKQSLGNIIKNDKPVLKPKSKVGRKPKADADKRNNNITCYVTDAELERFKTHIGDIPMGTYVRNLILRDMK